MEMKIEKTVTVDYIEIRFLNETKVEIEYIDDNADTIKIQHAESLEQGLELMKGENN